MNQFLGECVVRQINQGHNSRQALELCAKEMKDRFADEKKREVRIRP